MGNYVQRFLFDDLDIRGSIVHLGSVWEQLLAKRDYPESVALLLGQMSATTLLLADNLKQPGRLTLQLHGTPPLSLLVVDCNEGLNIRCMAHHDKNISDFQIMKLLRQGQLSLILDTLSMREPYQSIVPIVGANVAEMFEHYLDQSEQLPSRFFLATSPNEIAGLFLQKTPSSDHRDPDGWARIETLAATVQDKELLRLPSESLLQLLFHEETLRLYEPQVVTHDYPKDWDKVRNMLRTLGREEVYDALQDLGVIVIHDDFNNHEYRFDREAIDTLFANTPESSPTVH